MTGGGPEIAAAKQRIRATSLDARAAMSATQRAEAGVAIASHALDCWAGIERVAAFVSFGTEPPTRPLLDGFLGGGAEVLVPVVDDDGLDWVAYDSDGPRLGSMAVAAAQLVLVPALAVDRSGNRLGRGRGYYDRALADVTAPVVAVVYDAELVDAVPTEPHDRRVQGVVRPSGYLKL